jgi:hypothetical protein
MVSSAPRIEARAGARQSRVRAVELDETWRGPTGLGILDLTLRFEWEQAPESFVGLVRRCAYLLSLQEEVR